jgi:hypothetical protein
MYRTPAGLAPEIVYLKGRAPKGALPASVPSIGLETADAPLAKDIDVHQVSFLLFTVIFYANRAHSLTRSP